MTAICICLGIGATTSDQAQASPASGANPPVSSAKTANASKTGKATKAVKRPSYKIIYKLNGGTQAEKQIIRIAKGKTIKASKLKSPKRKYFKFLGWYSDKKLEKRATTLMGAKKKSGRIVYAKWKRASYRISYHLNGGKFSGGYKKAVKVGKKLSTKKLATPVRNGYTFAGWYMNSSLKKKAASLEGTSSLSKRAVYAKWKSNTYKITYVMNDESYAKTSVRKYKTVNGADSLLDPVRDGYSFIAWYSDPGLTDVVTSIPAETYGDITLYAKWRKRVAVAHRGFHQDGAAQNSIDAFRSAAEAGFSHVETDIRFTADSQPVLSHDETISVYAKGEDGEKTGDPFSLTISSVTLDSLQNDYIAVTPKGSDVEPSAGQTSNIPDAKNNDGSGESGADGSGDETDSGKTSLINLNDDQSAEKSTGTDASGIANAENATENAEGREDGKTANNNQTGQTRRNIAEFGEFLDVCKELGLFPYIELKEGTRSQVISLVSSVDKRGMTYDVRWTSFHSRLLEYVSFRHPRSNFALLTRTVTNAKIDTAISIASGGGDIFLGLEAAKATWAAVGKCQEAGMPLGAWTLRDEREIGAYDHFVSSFTLDGLHARPAPSFF